MVLTLTAKDAMTQRYKTVQFEDYLNTAVSLFDSETDVLFVFDNEKYKGSLTYRSIIRGGLDKETIKVKQLISPAPKVFENEHLTECARLMLENDAMQLPIVRNNRLIGVVTAESLLKVVAIKLFGDKKVEEMMSKDIIVCAPEDTLFSVANLFRNHQISRLPVVSNGELIGIISMHDLVKKANDMDKNADIFATINQKNSLYKLSVETIMSPIVETAKMQDNIRDVIKQMIDYDIGGVIVVDSKNLPLGMITKRDIIEHIVNLQEVILPVQVQISSKLDKINRNAVKEEFEIFVENHREELGTGRLYAYIVTVASKTKPTIQCRVRLNTDVVRVNLVGEGTSEMQAVKQCLNRLKIRFRKEKAKKQNRRLSEMKYIRK